MRVRGLFLILLGLWTGGVAAQTVNEQLSQGANRAQAKDYQGAVTAYTQAIQVKPLPEAFTGRGGARFFLGDSRGAIEDFNQAIQLNPQYAEAYNNRGAVKENQGDIAGAIDDLRQAAQLFQTQGEAGLAQRIRDMILRLQQ
ncbi:tetratricopeptide repeat protein [Candidatus Cyanaurora vandensis]|uniref:tetratricopeptide repeat protein n=1 Tax=Candidatus Cyanaurora vandensis TaxID=2714958 RepID=UPI00257F7962|nr:tetratricopeptide repeat protein [Candidatus Cyanaurora vandensis]